MRAYLRQTEFETEAGCIHPWGQFAARLPNQLDNAIIGQGAQRPRQVALLAAGQLFQLADRFRFLLIDNVQQQSVVIVEHLGKRLQRFKPDFRLVLPRTAVASGNGEVRRLNSSRDMIPILMLSRVMMRLLA